MKPVTRAHSSNPFFTHLECSRTGEHYERGRIQHLSRRGAPLLARYDLEAVRKTLSRESLVPRSFDLWRYRELLPIGRDDALFLGEGGTPLITAPKLGATLGLSHLFVKDESSNPTSSFKARGMAVAVAMARTLGASALACPSAGNAGAAMSVYAARAGLPAHVVVPKDAPRSTIAEARRAGAEVRLVDGLIGDAGRVVSEDCDRLGWYDLSTLKEPYRIEGKKTMGLELFEQLDGRLPHVILYPTGGATGLIGMWKAFAEMESIGWIGSERPRMVAVQADGCAPLVRAMDEGTAECRLWEEAHTTAPGLRVPKALGDFLALQAIRASNGCAVAVSDDDLSAEAETMTSAEGISCSPEGGACVAALRHLVRERWVEQDEIVVLFNTASGVKYL